MYPKIIYEEKVIRKIFNVYEDDRFIIDLSWKDDVASMKINNFPEKQYEDRNVKEQKNPPYYPFTVETLDEKKAKKDQKKSPKKLGRKVHPRTEYLPIKRALGRPTIESFTAKNLIYGKSQGSKPIISNEDVKHYRLVILNPLKNPNQDIKYAVTEVSTFYLQKDELDKMKELSWHLISNSEIGYFNPDLNLTEDFILPADFLPENFYSEESKNKRDEDKKKRDQTKANLNETFSPYIEFYKRFREITNEITLDSKNLKDAENKLRLKYFANKEGSIDLGTATKTQLTDFYRELEEFRATIQKETEEYKRELYDQIVQERKTKQTEERKREEKRKSQKLYGLGDENDKILIDVKEPTKGFRRFKRNKEMVDMDVLFGGDD